MKVLVLSLVLLAAAVAASSGRKSLFERFSVTPIADSREEVEEILQGYGLNPADSLHLDDPMLLEETTVRVERSASKWKFFDKIKNGVNKAKRAITDKVKSILSPKKKEEPAEVVPVEDVEVPQEIANKFAPIVYFDAGEEFFPSPVELFTQHTLFKYKASENGEAKEVRGPPNELLFKHASDGRMTVPEYPKPVNAKHADGTFLKGTPLDGKSVSSKVPVYMHSVKRPDSSYDLQYFIFFPFNGCQCFMVSYLSFKKKHGAYRVCDLATHLGDFERVIVRVDSSFSKVLGLLYGGHGDYHPHKTSEVQFHEGTHPHVYVAKDSHAIYHTAGHHTIDLVEGKFVQGLLKAVKAVISLFKIKEIKALDWIRVTPNKSVVWKTRHNVVRVRDPKVAPNEKFGWLKYEHSWGDHDRPLTKKDLYPECIDEQSKCKSNVLSGLKRAMIIAMKAVKKLTDGGALGNGPVYSKWWMNQKNWKP